MDLKQYRAELDGIDRQLVQLFCRRMEIAAEIGVYKREHDLPVLDPAREREILQSIAAQSPEELREDAAELYSLIFKLSRARQDRILSEDRPRLRDGGEKP